MSFQQGLASAAMGAGIGYKAYQDETARLDDKATSDELNKLKLNQVRMQDADATRANQEAKYQRDLQEAATKRMAEIEAQKAALDAQIADAPRKQSADMQFSQTASAGIQQPNAPQALPTGMTSTPDAAMGVGAQEKPSLNAAQNFVSATDTKPSASQPTTKNPLSGFQSDDASLYYLMAQQAKKDGKLGLYEGYSAKFKSANAEKRALLASDAYSKLRGGDTSGFVQLYNTGVHDGANIQGETGIEQSADGNKMHVFKLDNGKIMKVPEAYLVSRITEYGKPGSEFGAQIDSLKEQFLSGIKTNDKIRESGATGDTEKNKAAAVASLAAAEHSRAEAGKARREAVSPNNKYKVEGSEVATVLGDPAVDKRGKPITDPLSGRQMVNRNPAREDAFYKWMAANGIKDTNEGLAKYKALNAPSSIPAPTATTTKSTVNPAAFD